MASSSGSGGLADYCRHRPPGVLFLLCLLSFAITTMALSFYINHNNRVRNPDILDWNTLLRETGNLHFCLPNNQSDADRQHRQQLPGDTDRANISVSVGVSPDLVKLLRPYDLGNNVLVSVVKFSDMGRTVPHKYKGQVMVLTFALAEQQKALCIQVNAPASILLDVSGSREAPDNCSLPSGGEKKRQLHSASMDHVPLGWCDEGLVFQMALESHQQPEWTVMVSGEDQARIHIHLMVTSAFLFVLVGAILLGIFVRGLLFSSRRISSSLSQPHQPFKDEEDFQDF